MSKINKDEDLVMGVCDGESCINTFGTIPLDSNSSIASYQNPFRTTPRYDAPLIPKVEEMYRDPVCPIASGCWYGHNYNPDYLKETPELSRKCYSLNNFFDD